VSRIGAAVNVKGLVIPALGVLLVGCATATVNPYPNSGYAPSNPESVSVYYNFPPQPYKVIGEVYYSGAPAASWTGAGKLLRQEAAKIGGDAVVVQQQDTPYVGTITTPGYVSGSTYGTTRGSYFGSSYVGNYSAQSSYVYSPPTATPLYGKRIVGIVIKFQSTQSAPSIGGDGWSGSSVPTGESSTSAPKYSFDLVTRYYGEVETLVYEGEIAQDKKQGSTAAAKFEAAIDRLREIKSEITARDPEWLLPDIEKRISFCQQRLEQLKVKPE